MGDMQAQGLITKAKFAGLAGVTRAAATKAARPGGCLHEATVGDGRKMMIDSQHPAALAYLEARRVPGEPELVDTPPTAPVRKNKTGSAAAKETRKSAGIYNIDVSEVPEHMQDFANMTIRQVVAKFGTDYRMVDYLRALKEIEAIDSNRVKNAKAKGELVHRDLVVKGLLDPIDSAHRKMLTDGAKTIARRSVAMVGAGKTAEELEKFIAGQISSFIKPAKARIRRTLENVTA